ncbi:hypothetical protein [Neobacillus sp. PS2-9]|uniref:hypothetical protein n=1 Tax=Neobacillus sp. PS2-9 TaxID=3070676 RepID=UPI0027DEF029|nr:hypothetical protein [Neobacillus sp. PS2-9]WML57026.1 hypothetical protein RCG25_19145 [Neobacillus sp. PS2-9]
MPDKKEVEKESMEEKTPNKILQTNSVEEEKIVENEDMEQLSSLDVLWQHAFGEIDEWAKHAEFRDEIFLKEAKHFAESIKRNQGNVKDIAERFNKEFAEWERTAREEFLMTTTSLQHFFPIRSYEDINAQIDQIQKKTMSILSTPCQTLNNYLTMEKYLEMIDQYIELRKKGRMQYIKTVKQAGNIIYESQRGFVNLFARQIKSVMFPLNKYLEKTEELSKS